MDNTIHYLMGGITPCSVVNGVPNEWDTGHYWSSSILEVNCQECKVALFIQAMTEEGYYNIKQLPDGRFCGLYRFLFTEAIIIGMDKTGYQYRYCYKPETIAAAQLEKYDGTEEPTGWIVKK